MKIKINNNKKNNRNNKNKGTSNTGGSTTAADRASAIRNSGIMLAKKAKVEKKPNDYSTLMKRNLTDFEQAFANARKNKQKIKKYIGQRLKDHLSLKKEQVNRP